MGGPKKSYSVSPGDYKLLEEVGYGASATVYRAIYIPLNEVVAVKCLDLDRCNSNLDDIRREAQTMSLIDHANVIRAYCSFVVEHCLWVIMPFMAEGSCLHLMKIAYPDGFEEATICCILKETLKALEYLHRHGHIHRDVKAGNILLDSNGRVKLGDFGVSACMFDRGDRQRSRNTFVGTPCWMAPEVLQPGSGYDFKADIWSFGITALELAHGHAPFSKHPPMKVLLMTIQNAPPGLDDRRDKRFSKLSPVIQRNGCHVSGERSNEETNSRKIIKALFFKHAKPPDHSVKNLLADLPPLWDRVKALQLKDAAQLALKKMPSAEQEALSQNEYQRGVSAWNFDVEDLKIQASLIQDDDDEFIGIKDDDENLRPFLNDKDSSVPSSSFGKLRSTDDIAYGENSMDVDKSDSQYLKTKYQVTETDLLDSSGHEKADRYEKEGSAIDPLPSTSKRDTEVSHCKSQVGKTRQTYSGPLMPASVLNHTSSERGRFFERCEDDNLSATEKCKRDARKAPNFSGPLMLPNRASANSLSAPIRSSGGYRDSLDDKSKNNVVQIKGRFSVTSENVDLVKDIPLCTVSRRSSQGSPLRKSASVGDWLDAKPAPIALPKEFSNSAIPASILMPHLQNLFQQTLLQQDLIMNLLNTMHHSDIMDVCQNGIPQQSQIPEDDVPNEMLTSERERVLQIKISELQARMINLTDELNAEKLRHAQLQQQLNAAYGRGMEEDKIRIEDKEHA